MINRITNKTPNKSTLTDHLKVDNLEIHNAKEISTEFAKYFSTIGKKYANNINPSATSIHTYINNIPNNPSTICLNPISLSTLLGHSRMDVPILTISLNSLVTFEGMLPHK